MEGAIRETREEANADVEVISPFAQLDIPLIGQVTKNQHLFIILPFLLDLLMQLQIFSHGYGMFEADLYNLLSKVEEPPFFTWSRIIRMPAFPSQ